MRFVYYIDSCFSVVDLEKFQKDETARFKAAGMLREGDTLLVIPRPGYITELQVLVGE